MWSPSTRPQQFFFLASWKSLDVSINLGALIFPCFVHCLWEEKICTLQYRTQSHRLLHPTLRAAVHMRPSLTWIKIFQNLRELRGIFVSDTITFCINV